MTCNCCYAIKKSPNEQTHKSNESTNQPTNQTEMNDQNIINTIVLNKNMN